MATPGRTHTIVVDAADATAVPSAKVIKLDTSGSELEVLPNEVMDDVEGGACYALDWDVPNDVELKSHIAIITIPIAAGSRITCQEIPIVVDVLAGAVVIGSDQTQYGGFVLEKIALIRRDQRRILEEGLVQIPRVEVEGTTVSFTRQTIRAGDTPLFQFKQFVEDTKIPLDITGATIKFRATPQLSAGPLTWDRVTTITDGTGGRHEVRLTAADTATAAVYDADIQVTLATGVVLTTPKFAINIEKAVA